MTRPELTRDSCIGITHNAKKEIYLRYYYWERAAWDPPHTAICRVSFVFVILSVIPYSIVSNSVVRT